MCFPLPRMTPLNDEIARLGLPASIASIRKRAKDLGACYKIGSRFFVTSEQLVEIITSYMQYPPSNLRQPSLEPTRRYVDHGRWVQKFFADIEKEKQRKQEKRKQDQARARRKKERERLRVRLQKRAAKAKAQKLAKRKAKHGRNAKT